MNHETAENRFTAAPAPGAVAPRLAFDKKDALLWGIIIALLLVACGWRVAERVFETRVHIWDDALMVTRYAGAAIATGVPSWNPGGSPTYGMTAPLFLIMAVPAQLVAKTPLLSAFFSSVFPGILLLVGLSLLCRRTLGGNIAGALMGFTLLVAAMTRPEMTIHLESGMDTTFAMAYLCGYLLLFDMWRAHPEGRLRFVVGITGGLAFFARPDLPLFTLLLPACLMIGKSRTERGPIVSTLLITLVGVGACIVFAKLLFGAPLPLSFYAKSTALYGISVWQTYAGVGKEQLLNFVWANWPSLLCIVAGSAAGVRAPVSDRERALLGTILAIAIFWGYYAVFALQIMPFEARFYYPTLPAVLYAAWLALAAVWERRGAPGKPARIVSIVICGAVCLWLGFGSLGSGALSLREWNRTKWFTPFDPVIEYRARYAKYWLFLDKFSTLPDDLIIATGEVGRVAAMNPRKTILDLSGLNDTDIALHGFSAARFFAVHKPDLMYLPHPHYREAWEEILRNPAFAREYDLYPAEDYGVTLDVAVNKASPLYAEMTRIMGQGK